MKNTRIDRPTTDDDFPENLGEFLSSPSAVRAFRRLLILALALALIAGGVALAYYNAARPR